MKPVFSVKTFLCFLLLSIGLPALSNADLAVPPLKARITDLTGTLTATQIETLEAVSSNFESSKGGQIVVLMIPSLEGEPIENYAIRVADQWKIGRKGSDDGAILLIAKNDRKMRIDVRYGYEGTLTDAASSRIIREIITPKFKQGDFFGGIQDGLQAIINQVSGEQMPAPERSISEGFGFSEDSVVELLFFGIAVLVSLTNTMRRYLGKLITALLIGLVAGAIGYFFLSLFFGILAAVVSFLFSLLDGPGKGSRSGGYSGRSSSSGWSSSSSSSGFSGGGGSGGGGGASGSW